MSGVPWLREAGEGHGLPRARPLCRVADVMRSERDVCGAFPPVFAANDLAEATSAVDHFIVSQKARFAAARAVTTLEVTRW